jgi:uncharacterized membrane protein
MSQFVCIIAIVRQLYNHTCFIRRTFYRGFIQYIILHVINITAISFLALIIFTLFLNKNALYDPQKTSTNI